MKKFTYKVKSKDGQILTGEIEASSQQNASKIIITKQLFPIEINEITKDKFSIKNIPFLSFLDKVSTKKKSIIIRQFATLIRSGLSVTQSLEAINNEIKDEKIKEVFTSVLIEVEGGSQLSQAFAQHLNFFSSIDISLVKVGEKSGNLDKTLDRMASQLEKDSKIISKVRSAFTYPIIVALVAIGVVAVMLIYLVPKLSELYEDFQGDLPLITKIMIATSGFMTKFWWLIIIFLIALVSTFFTYIKSTNGRKIWDNFKLSIPLIKDLLIKVYMARFTRTMETLIGSGVSITESLIITAGAVGNEIYKKNILEITEKVRQGNLLSKEISGSKLFPSLASQMIRVGEETGELDNMLGNLANYYEEEVDNVVKAISTIIEPVVIVVMGLVVLLILVGVMSPIYGIAQYMFRQ